MTSPIPTRERASNVSGVPSVAPAPNRRRGILFAKLGSFSHTNERVLEQLNARFPGHVVETFDVKDYVKRRFGITALNALIEVMTYGPSVMTTASGRHAFFFLTPFMFQHLSAAIVREYAPRAQSFQFSIQTQGLFNAALPNRPFYVYTDQTIASHLEYPTHDPRLFRSKALLALEQALFQRADRILVTAKHVERTLIQHYRCDPNRVATILIGANVQAGASSDERDRYAAGQILFVGIEWERKGGPTLLAAFERVAEAFPHATLTIAGCMPPVSHPRVRALGLIPRPKVAALLARSSIFCLPSVIEPSAVASVEAMAFKLPVIATNVGGFPGMVADGESGILVPSGDVAALAAALADLLAHPEKARDMGLAGYARSRDLFTWDVVGERLRAEICGPSEAPEVSAT